MCGCGRAPRQPPRAAWPHLAGRALAGLALNTCCWLSLPFLCLMVLGMDPGWVLPDLKKEIYNKAGIKLHEPHRRQGNYIPNHFPISALYHEKFISTTIRLEFATVGMPRKGWRMHPQNSLPMGCFLVRHHTRVMLQWTRLGTFPYGPENCLRLVPWSRMARSWGTWCWSVSTLTAQPESPLVRHQSASDVARSHEDKVTSRHFDSLLSYSWACISLVLSDSS